MLNEFKTFIARGNVLDLAVAVIIGAAFGRIVTSLTEDVLMPAIGRLFGGLNFSGYFLLLGDVPESLAGSTDYAALKKAGVPMIGYGEFVTQAVNFLIVGFIIFLIVRAINRVLPPEPAAPPGDAPELAVLKEIRDELRAGRG